MTVLEEADHRKRLIYLETVQQEQIGGGYYYRSQVNAWDGVAPPIEIVSDSCSSPCVHTSWTVAPFRDADGLLEYFIGGSFESLGGVPARNVARWDGVSWHAADSGLSPGSFVRRLTATSISGSPTLYATRNLGSSTEYQAVIRWTGQSWSPPIATCNGTISTLVPFDDGQPSLFALGRFTSINGRRATNIARTLGPLESPVWAPVGQCPGDTVRALARIPEGSGTLAPGLYAAGSFTTAGTAIAPAVARWNGSQWSNLGLGVNSRIDSLTLATINGRVSLFAGGAFTGAGNELAPHIASWDGRIWTALGEGLSGDVLAMTPLAGDLIAAGRFTSSGAAPLAHIARWNGATWSPLSTGLNGEVRALAPVDSPPNATLYAAGDFTSAGGHAANRVARWNGKWSAMGDGFDGPVNALAFYDDGLGAYLVAAGEFEHSGSTAVSHIARWTGQSWVPMGQGVNGVVNSLAVFDPDGSGPALVRLAVGGSFTQADGQPAARLAQWVGSTWRPFEGQPDDGAVLSLCVADPDGAGEEPYSLFLGGSFTHIAGLSSPNIGQWGTCECYANCDHSTTIPTLTASDFQCFLNRFASADPYANCDGSTLPPTLSANDFQCFLNRFAAGCP